MRTHARLLFAGSLLAGAVALGCQAPPPTQPGARAPRVVHQVGKLQLTPDTNLALQFEQPCADGAPTYALKALDTRIDEIDVTIVGPTHPAPGHTETITRAQFDNGCSMNKLFENLFPGQYTVSMKGYKLNATPGGPRIPTMRSEATQTITVGTEAVETVVLKCDFTTGSVNVEINCCSPAPPTPTPTATPEPTPVPSPTETPPVVVPASELGMALGLEVDPAGNVFVLGMDPGSSWTGWNTAATWDFGRIVRVDPVARGSSVYFDEMLPTVDIEIANGSILLSNTDFGLQYQGWGPQHGKAASTYRVQPLPTGPGLAGTPTVTYVRGGITTSLAATADFSAVVSQTNPTLTLNGLFDMTISPATGEVTYVNQCRRSNYNGFFNGTIPQYPWVGSDTSYANYASFEKKGHVLRNAPAHGLFWTSPSGFLQPGAVPPPVTPSTPPVMPPPPIAHAVNDGTLTLGMDVAADGDVFYARSGSTGLQHYDAATGTRTSYALNGEYPRMVEIGPDDSVYVLSFTNLTNASGSPSSWYYGNLWPSATWRVWRFDRNPDGTLGTPKKLISSAS